MDPLLLHWKVELGRSIEAISKNVSAMWMPKALPQRIGDGASTAMELAQLAPYMQRAVRRRRHTHATPAAAQRRLHTPHHTAQRADGES